MRKSLVVLFLSIPSIYCSGQNLPEVIKSAPEAASLGKYGEIPVSFYTGVPNINIPLYAVQDGDINVPISLSYHAGGFKVEEEADWTGLGWSLISGGSITRSIRGFDDFQIGSYKGYYYNQDLPDPLGYGTPYQQFAGPITGALNDTYMLFKNGVYRDYSSYVAAPNVDWESDLYYFNLNGLSGKFVLDEQKKPVLIQQQKINIQLTYNKQGWIIQDEKGFTYTFVSSQTTSAEIQESVTAWYLTKIESPTGHSVTFEYDKTQDYRIKSLPSYTENKLNAYAITTSFCSDGITPEGYASPSVRYQMHYLRAIKFNNGYVKFMRNSDFPEMAARLDVIGAEKLVAIQVYQQSNQSGTPRLLKEYKLDYDYFNVGGGGIGYQDKFLGSYPEFDSDKRGKRLKLLRVTECGEDNNCKPPHVLEYNETVNLPPKTSFSRDFWGYANGRLNFQLVPEHYGTYSTANGEELLYFFGANRNPNNLSAQANLLQKITYPSSGSTRFTYHINEYSNFETPEYQTEDYGPYYFDQGRSNNTGAVTFTVNKESSVSFRIEIHGDGYVFDQQDNFYVQLTGVSAKTWTLVDVQNNIRTTEGNYYVYKLMLLPGTYTLSSNLPQDASEAVTIRVATTWSEIIQSAPLTRKPGGGVRVEKIEDFDPETGITSVRSFNYDNSNGYSSGMLMSYPRFVRNISSDLCKTLVRSSTSNIPLSTSAGGLIGYGKVTVLYGANGENGKTEYFYHNTPDLEKSNDKRMPNIPTFSDNRNGNLLQQIDYARNGVVYRKIKEVNNSYSIGSPPWKVVWNMSVQQYFRTLKSNPDYDIYNPQSPQAIPEHGFWITHYGTVSNWNRLISTTIKVYDQQDETKYSERISQYTYANEQHFQPTRITTTDSKGLTVIADNTYPADFTGTEYGSNVLRDKHVHSQILTETITKGVDVTSKAATTYKLDQGNTVVDFVQVAPSGGNLETRIRYYQYDSAANILEISKSDEAHIVYLWGYNHSYPVAEIKNTTYQEVLNVLGQAAIDQLNSSPNTDEQIRQMLNVLRTDARLKKAFITTYTYDPLIGKTSATDSNNNTVYFEYDPLGRLKLVRDQNKRIIKHYEYHYQAR